MKYTIVLISFHLLCLCNCLAQFDPDADVFNKITDEVCSCITDHQKEGENIDGDFVSTCMESATINHLKEFMEVNNITTLSREDGQQLGELIGGKLLKECPALIDIAFQMNQEEDEAIKTNQVSGVLKKISGKDIGRIIIETPEGKEETFYLIGPLEEDPDDILADISSYKGREITVNWMDTDIFSPKISMFVPVRQLMSIRLFK